MANRYWVGGSGTWNSSSTANWSSTSGGAPGASYPTSGDSVFFDQPGSYTVSLILANCADFTISSGAVVTFTGFGTTQIYGSMYLTSDTTWNTTGNLSFRSNSTGKTINTNGCVLGAANLYFDGIGGSWALNNSISTNATTTVTLNNGSLILNNYSIYAGTFVSANSNTRSINFGTGNIVVTTPTSGTSTISMNILTNFSWSGTGGFISNAEVTRTFAVGGSAGGDSNTAINLSITSGSSALSFTSSSWFNNLDFTGNTSTISAQIKCSGSLTLDPSGNYSGLAVTIPASNVNIYPNGNTTLLGLIINCPGGYFSLTGPLSLGVSTTIIGFLNLTSGTLNLNGYDLTTTTFNSSNTNTRSINFGSNNIQIAGASAGGGLTMADATNFSWTGTGKFVFTMSTGKGIAFGSTAGGSVTNAPNISITSGGSLPSFTANSWFNTLDYTGSSTTTNSTSVYVSNLILSGTGTYTGLPVVTVGTGTITSNGKTINSLTVNNTGTTKLMDSLTVGSTGTTLTSGTLDLNGYDLTTGLFRSDNPNSRSIIFGTNNIILNHGTAGTTVLSMADITNFAWTGTGGFTTDMPRTRTFVCGTTAGGSASNAPNLILTSGASVPTISSGGWFNKLDFASSTGNPNITSLNLSSLVLGGGTYTNLTPTMAGTGSIVPNGKVLGTLIINSTGTVTLADNLTTTVSTQLNSGTLNLAGYTLTPTQFISSITATRNITGPGTIALANDWTVSDGTGFTGTNYTISMLKTTAKTFAGAGGSYGTLSQGGTGTLTITGSNSFEDIIATVRPCTISFEANTTQTVNNFSLNGTSGNLVTLNSNTPGTKFTLSKSTGTIVSSYLNIQDSNAVGGARWDVSDGTSVNLGNTGGWIFVISSVSGQFMAFFF